MNNININHIRRIEGHTGFLASVINGDVKSAKMAMRGRGRLIEGVLIGRHYQDMPVIAERICGICSVAHNIASIKAVEDAMQIKVSEETGKLRKAMMCGHFINSHAMHLFFITLSDLLDIENDLKLAEEYSEETAIALKIREYGMEIIKTIGGRAIHPITNEVGGFKKVPSEEEIKNLIMQGEELLPMALKLSEFLKKIKMPDFSRPTEYICLEKKGEYLACDGDVVSNKGLHVHVDNLKNKFHEFQRPKEILKRTEGDGKSSYMVGAIARINNQSDKLSMCARKYLESLNFKLPDYNPFHNILYQMVEIIHCIETSVKLMKELAHADMQNALTKEFVFQEGSVNVAVESPRGTLYYWVDVDGQGFIKNVNIITPTAQFLTHMEDDVAAFVSGTAEKDKKQMEKKMRAFIRAYDPCVNCAGH